MATWIDLSEYGLSLFVGVVRPPIEGLSQRIIVAAGKTEENLASLVGLGFVLDKSGVVYHPSQPNMAELVRRFPRAKVLRDVDVKSFARIVSNISGQPGPATSVGPTAGLNTHADEITKDAKDAEHAKLHAALKGEVRLDENGQRLFSFDGRHIVALGLNQLGQEVYSLDGRRFIVSEDDAGVAKVVWEGGGEAAIFLRPQTHRQLVRSASGVIISVLRGHNMRLNDLRLFASATQGKAPTDQTLDLGSSALAIEEAAINWLASNPGQSLGESFARAAKIQEGLAYRESLPTLFSELVPLPVLVATQRVLGTLDDYRDKHLVGVGMPLPLLRSVPLGQASFYSTTDVNTDWLREALAVTAATPTKTTIAPWQGGATPHDILVYWGGRRSGTSSAGVQTEDGSRFARQDFCEAVSMLGQRARNGRTVLLFSADENTKEQEEFFAWLLRHYTIEGRGEIVGALHSALPSAPSLHMIVVGMARPEPMLSPPEELFRKTTIADWQSLYVWTNSIIQARAAINEYYISLRKEKELTEARGVEPGEPEIVQNKFQAVYVSASRVGQASAMVPRNMEKAARAALSRVVKKYGDIDAMVSQELRMPQERLGEVFSPEQVDAIALAIDCEKRGRGFLLADQTGIGKGRTLAALMYRSILLGNKALFFTEREINISDIWRDFRSIGVADEIKPFILNAGTEVVDALTGEVLLRAPKRKDINDVIASGAWPEGDYNLLIATYSQINRPPLNEGRRRARVAHGSAKTTWLLSVMRDIGNTVSVFLDESHNPAGNSNMARNIEKVIEHASWCMFSSATFAKRAQNVDFYSRLFPPHAVGDSGISSVLQRGGEVLQEACSAMLVEDGVMVRREHDLSKCEFTISIDEERFQRNRDEMDKLAPILAEMANLSGDVSTIINAHNERIRLNVLGALGNAPDDAELGNAMRRIRSLQVAGVSFGSPLYRISRLFTSSMLVDQVVDEAVGALRRGEKPIILLENTSEPILTELFLRGDADKRPTFRMAIMRIIHQMTKKALEVMTPNRADEIEEKIVELAAVKLKDKAEELVELLGRDDNVDELVSIAKRELSAALLASGEEWISANLPDGVVEDRAAEDELHQNAVPAVAPNAPNEAAAENEAGAEPEVVVLRNCYMEAVSRLVQAVERVTDADVLAECVRFPSSLLRPTVSRRVNKVIKMLDGIPDLSLSVIDSIKEGIENRGRELFDDGLIPAPWKCGEITGRRLEYRDGEIRVRGDRDIMVAKNVFNSGGIDVLVINNRGTTGIDLHASALFADQRRRVLLELQPPTDIMRCLQAYGRVNRYDQVVGPRIVSVLSGLPMETRLVLMRNAKLSQLSANTTSNREHSSKVPAPDMLNAVGDRVVGNYLGMRPELARRLGLETDFEVANAGENGRQEIDNFERRSANTFLSRLVMLTVAEQEQIFKELVAEYNSVVEELDARGANPLKSHTIEGKVHERAASVIEAPVAGGDDVSAFYSPLYTQEIIIEHPVLPMNSDEVVKQYERGMVAMQSDDVLGYAEMVDAQRSRYLEGFLPPHLTLQRAMEDGLKTIQFIHDRTVKLAAMLRQMEAGSLISLSFDGDKQEAVVTRVVPPDRRDMFSPSAYRVMLAIPGSTKITTISLRTLMDDKEFSCGPGLSGDSAEGILARFDSYGAGRRLERRIVLAGNEWAAVNMSLDNGGLGTFTQWVGEDGMRRRGVLVAPKNEASLEFVPVALRSFDVAWQALSSPAEPFRPTRGNIVLRSKCSGLTVSRVMVNGAPSEELAVKILARFLREFRDELSSRQFQSTVMEVAMDVDQRSGLRFLLNQTGFRALWTHLSSCGIGLYVDARYRSRILDMGSEPGMDAAMRETARPPELPAAPEGSQDVAENRPRQ